MHVSALLGAHAGVGYIRFELVVNFAAFRQQRFRFQLVVSPCPFQAETKCLETQGRVHSTVTRPRSTSKDSHNANESKVFVLKHLAHACASHVENLRFQLSVSPPLPPPAGAAWLGQGKGGGSAPPAQAQHASQRHI